MAYNKLFEKQFECKTSDNLIFNRHLYIMHASFKYIDIV